MALFEQVQKLLTAAGKYAVIETGTWALLKKNSATYNTEIEVLKATMLDIAKIQLKEGTRAYKHMEYFLSGKGGKVELDAQTMFNEDEGVRNRVIAEAFRRSLEFKTARELAGQKTTAKQPVTPRFPNGIDPTISIFQHTWAIDDWRLAVGSYSFEVMKISSPAKSTSSFWVELKGDNAYQWHEKAKRITKSIHEIGQLLVDAKAAADFDMVTKPYHLLINPKHAKIIEMTTVTQTNPKYEHGDFDLGTVARAAKVMGTGLQEAAAQATKKVQQLWSEI